MREHLLAVARYWLERGIDGWRLDVPAEVPADFWVAFRQVVRDVNPEAWIVGEVWGDARPWLGGDHFDGVMNYRLGWSSLCWVAGDSLRQTYRNKEYPLRPLSTEALIEIWSTTAGWYRPAVNQAQMNLLDSHDVPRALHTLSGDVDALKQALLLLFLQPGAPCIYYGTEAGLAGGPDGDHATGPGPACREAVPWGASWSVNLSAWIAELTALRQRYSVLKQGARRWTAVGTDGLMGDFGELQVWINRSKTKPLQLDAAQTVMWSSHINCSSEIIPPRSIALLVQN